MWGFFLVLFDKVCKQQNMHVWVLKDFQVKNA